MQAPNEMNLQRSEADGDFDQHALDSPCAGSRSMPGEAAHVSELPYWRMGNNTKLEYLFSTLQSGGQFEDQSQHYHAHFQAAASAYQPQPQYVDMSKPAAGRVTGQGLPQAQAFNVPRAQHQAYNALVPDAQDQPSAQMPWNAAPPQSAYYIATAGGQSMRQRMPAMNNGQVPGNNFTLMPGMASNMAPFMANSQMSTYNGNSMQNPAGQFVVGNQFMPYQQQRMPYQMAQGAPMGFMQPYGPHTAGGSYQPYYPNPLQMSNTNRPSSAGPQGAGGPAPKSNRPKRILKMTDPNTGEDLTDKVFKAPTSEDSDPSAQETQAHRNAVTLEFATKVAILANNKERDPDTSHTLPSLAPAQAAEASGHQHPMQAAETVPAVPSSSLPAQQTVPQPSDSHTVLNGEPDQNIPKAHAIDTPTTPGGDPITAQSSSAAPCCVPAGPAYEDHPQPIVPQHTKPPQQPATPQLQTVAPQEKPADAMTVTSAASPTPSAPLMPRTEAGPVVSAVPAKELSPAPVIEKPCPEQVPPVAEQAPAREATPPAEPTPASAAVQSAPVSPADIPSAPSDNTTEADSKTASQASNSGPQPQRQDGRKNKKNRKDLNKKSKEGSDMDAFYDTQANQENPDTASTDGPAGVASTAVPSPPAVLAAASADTPAEVPRDPSPPSEAAAAPQPLTETSTPVESKSPSPVEFSTAPVEAQMASGDTKPVVEKPPTRTPIETRNVPIDTKPAPVDSKPNPTVEKPALVDTKPSPVETKSAPVESKPPAVPVESRPSMPEVKAEEPAAAVSSAENGVEATEAEEKPRSRQINGVQIQYKEGQWSPANPEGKKQYDRDFLLKLQANPESRKAPDLPDMPDIIIDPRMIKMEDTQKVQMLTRNTCAVDFTPGFFKSTPRAGGPGSMNKRGSQQGRREGRGSQVGEQQRVIPSMRQEITLHKADNAYKPLFQKDSTDESEDIETQKLMRTFQGILNKLTPQKYPKLSKEAVELKIDTEERVIGVCNLIFEKAISEPNFAVWYAHLCKDMLKLPKVPKKENPNEWLTFRAILLTKCQKEFESDTIVEGDLDRRRKELESADEDKKAQLLMDLDAATVKARRRSMGNIRFIGELYKLKMLTEHIMHDCIFKLLKIRDDDSIECLCKLLETIGKDLDHQKAKQRMDQYFAQFEKMVADMTGTRDLQSSSLPRETRESKAKDSKDKLCTRVKFSVLEIMDMRRNNWEQRQIHQVNKPTTIEAIHQKVKQEQQEAQFLNSQPRPDPNPNRGAKGKGRGSMQGDQDGWNTVPAKPVRQQIDAAKMKITKTNVDETTLSLGGSNKFSSWGRGSQGGGSRSQEQDKSGNRYNALNNLNDNDGRRGYGRSPARGDSRGGRMGGDRDRDRRDRDRDFRKPTSRSSMESERERALASTRSILGPGATSNPSSRGASRDNSRSRDMPPAASARVSTGPDAKQMTPDELSRRLTTIAEELHSNGNIRDARESFLEIRNLDLAQVVTTLLEKLVEKPGSTRKILGQLLFEMVKEKQLVVDDLIKGIAELLEFSEDLELDIPKIWDNLAEIFANLVQDNKVIPLNFMKACMRPLVMHGAQKEAVLVQKILTKAAEYKSKDAVQIQWATSGLKLADFNVNEKAQNFVLQWLKSPVRNTVYAGVCSLLQNPGCTNEEVFQWIDKNFSSEERETNQFIRELTSAICRSYIRTETKTLDSDGLKRREPVLRRYLEDDKEKGTQALFGVQHLLCDLEHPQGLVRNLFDLFYDEDIISEDSFFEWDKRDGPPDDMVGKGVVKMNVKDFFDWLSNGEDDKAS